MSKSLQESHIVFLPFLASKEVRRYKDSGNFVWVDVIKELG